MYVHLKITKYLSTLVYILPVLVEFDNIFKSFVTTLQMQQSLTLRIRRRVWNIMSKLDSKRDLINLQDIYHRLWTFCLCLLNLTIFSKVLLQHCKSSKASLFICATEFGMLWANLMWDPREILLTKANWHSLHSNWSSSFEIPFSRRCSSSLWTFWWWRLRLIFFELPLYVL